MNRICWRCLMVLCERVNVFLRLGLLKKKTQLSNDSLADHSPASCQFLKWFWREFTPCCVEHLQQDPVDWWTLPRHWRVKLPSAAQLGLDPETALATSSLAEFWQTAEPLNILEACFWVVTLLKDGSDPGSALSAGYGMVIGNLLLFDHLQGTPRPSCCHSIKHFSLFSQFWELYWKTSK